MSESSWLRSAQRAHIDALRQQIESLPAKTEQQQEVRLEVEPREQVAWLTVHSGAKNALSGRMISQLTERIDRLHELADSAAAAAADDDDDDSRQAAKLRCVILRGHGECFCSGSDLVSVRHAADQEWGLKLAEVMQYNLLRLQQLPVPVVALVQGYALGGGAELALGADLRLMTEEAKIGFVHLRVGVCCGWGGGARLVELLGPSRAFELLSSGRTLGAREALELGLANRVLVGVSGPAETEAAAREFALQHAPPGVSGAMRALKAMVNGARELTLTGALANEAQLFASTWGKRAHLSALSSNIKHRGQQQQQPPESQQSGSCAAHVE